MHSIVEHEYICRRDMNYHSLIHTVNEKQWFKFVHLCNQYAANKRVFSNDYNSQLQVICSNAEKFTRCIHSYRKKQLSISVKHQSSTYDLSQLSHYIPVLPVSIVLPYQYLVPWTYPFQDAYKCTIALSLCLSSIFDKKNTPAIMYYIQTYRANQNNKLWPNTYVEGSYRYWFVKICFIRYGDTSVQRNCIFPGRYAPLTYYEDVLEASRYVDTHARI